MKLTRKRRGLYYPKDELEVTRMFFVKPAGAASFRQSWELPEYNQFSGDPSLNQNTEAFHRKKLTKEYPNPTDAGRTLKQGWSASPVSLWPCYNCWIDRRNSLDLEMVYIDVGSRSILESSDRVQHFVNQCMHIECWLFSGSELSVVHIGFRSVRACLLLKPRRGSDPT